MCLCFATGLSSCSGNRKGQAESRERELPNIIFLFTDDLGYGDLQCYNPDSRIPTPNLNKLAENGMLFTDAHAPSSVCSPTRYALLTGRYAWRTDELKTGVLNGLSPPIIEEERLTVAELLQEKGYRTSAFGKWHLGSTYHLKDTSLPVSRENVDWSKPIISRAAQQGFDYAYQINIPGYTFNENDSILAEPTEHFVLTQYGKKDYGIHDEGMCAPGYKHEHMLPAWTDKTIEFIRETAATKQAFFIYWAPICPHLPLAPNKEFIGKSGAGIYGDFVYELDASVGAIMDALEEAGQAENTLVLFSSDNGPEKWAYDRIQEYDHYSMGNLRGVKRDALEGGHRVPFIAHWPARIPAGSTSDELVSLVDFMATAASITGYELQEEMAEDSYNILPALLGEDLSEPIREATVYHASNGVLALRKGEWVYIDAPSGDVSREPQWFSESLGGVSAHDEEAELYHLSDDPTQNTNLYREYPEKAKELKTLLEKYKMEGRSR